MFDLDPASWAALVAQLVRASIRSAECRGFESHLRQLIFIFSLPHAGVCLSVFLSFFLSFHLKCYYVNPFISYSSQLSLISCLSSGQYTTGRGSSGVGLTAAVMKDPITGDMTLGVSADQGYLNTRIPNS